MAYHRGNPNDDGRYHLTPLDSEEEQGLRRRIADAYDAGRAADDARYYADQLPARHAPHRPAAYHTGMYREPRREHQPRSEPLPANPGRVAMDDVCLFKSRDPVDDCAQHLELIARMRQLRTEVYEDRAFVTWFGGFALGCTRTHLSASQIGQSPSIEKSGATARSLYGTSRLWPPLESCPCSQSGSSWAAV
jgi:hypothetical protein